MISYERANPNATVSICDNRNTHVDTTFNTSCRSQVNSLVYVSSLVFGVTYCLGYTLVGALVNVIGKRTLIGKTTAQHRTGVILSSLCVGTRLLFKTLSINMMLGRRITAFQWNSWLRNLLGNRFNNSHNITYRLRLVAYTVPGSAQCELGGPLPYTSKVECWILLLYDRLTAPNLISWGHVICFIIQEHSTVNGSNLRQDWQQSDWICHWIASRIRLCIDNFRTRHDIFRCDTFHVFKTIHQFLVALYRDFDLRLFLWF